MLNRVSWVVGLFFCIALWPLSGATGDHQSHNGRTQNDLHVAGEHISVDHIDKVENVFLTHLFLHYETDTNRLVDLLSTMMNTGGPPNAWGQVHQLAVVLREQSAYLQTLGKRTHNLTWEYYASNLYNHCLELEEAAKLGDGRESIFLVAILVNHLGQIQSANPQWLKWYLNKQIRILDTGIDLKDQGTVRDAAEIIHTSAGKILMSASVMPELYVHQNWQRNMQQLNRLGDIILGDVNRGDWEKVQENTILIKHLYLRWANSFKESVHDQ